MGEFFELTDDDKALSIGYWDDMLNEFGSQCRLNYKTTEQNCPNCIIDPNTHKSTNRYKPGGPQPFGQNEVCPVCNGTGKIPGTESFDIITMVINREIKPGDWAKFGSTTSNVVQLPSNAVITRGFSTDFIKVSRCTSAILDVNIQYTRDVYKLYGKPYIQGAISRDRYFMAAWELFK